MSPSEYLGSDWWVLLSLAGHSPAGRVSVRVRKLQKGEGESEWQQSQNVAEDAGNSPVLRNMSARR